MIRPNTPRWTTNPSPKNPRLNPAASSPTTGSPDSLAHQTTPPLHGNILNQNKKSRSTRILWPVSLGILAAFLTILAVGIEYTAELRFKTDRPKGPIRSALLDFLWQRSNSGTDPMRCSLAETDSSDLLSVTLLGRKREALARAADRLAGEIQAHIDSLIAGNQQRRQRERAILDEFLRDFFVELQNTEKLAEQMRTAAPDHSPYDSLERLGQRLEAHIETLNKLRTAEGQVSEQIARLVEPQSSAGIVSEETRRAAYAEHEDVTQDLAQLRIQLELGERLLLQTWQEASPMLDELISVASELSRACVTADDLSEIAASALSDASRLVGSYLRRVTDFASNWTPTFTNLTTEPVDPFAPRLMDTQTRAKDLLGDFEYRAGAFLENLRRNIQTLSEQAGPDNHLFASRLKRLYHRLESEHRRFTFTASNVRRRNNFRLDAALRSAEGLANRVRLLTARIDAELEAEAIEKERSTRAAASSRAEELRAQLRADINSLVEQIAALFERYDELLPETRKYLEPVLGARAADAAAQSARARLERCRTFVARLRSFQEAEPVVGPIHFVGSSMSLDRSSLVRLGVLTGLVAALVFSITLHVQARRKNRTPSRVRNA